MWLFNRYRYILLKQILAFKYLIENLYCFTYTKICYWLFLQYFEDFHKNQKYPNQKIIILKMLENKFEIWNIFKQYVTVLYMYIMYIQCIILSFCISLSISFFMYIFIDFVLLLYLKSKSKWIIIHRVYKNYVCNTSNSHRLFLYMNLLEKFRTWYNNLDNCTTVNQNMQNKKRWRV